MIQRITVTDDAQIFEVTNLFDRQGDETNELWKAESCVVKLHSEGWWTGTLDQIPVYTVH